MFIMNRFTGEYCHMDCNISKDRRYKIYLNEDIEFFEVDEIIAPVLQKLIKNKVIPHWSCSGHIIDDVPYLVINNWGSDLIEYINKRIHNEKKFHEDYIKYVAEISCMTVHMDKNIFEEYQIREDVIKTPCEPIADVIGEDGMVESYVFLATGIYFKTYDQYCDENKIQNPTVYDRMKYYVNLWELVDRTIDDIFHG